MTDRAGVTGAALLLTVLTALSQLLGFVRDAVIAGVFGVSSELDAYLVAQGVMNLVLALVAGAMARAVVPPVSRSAASGDTERSARTVQTALGVSVVVLLVGSTVVLLATDAIVWLLAPGFDDDTAGLAASLTQVILISVVFVAATNIVSAAAQAHGRYLLSGLEGVPFNLVMIIAAAGFGAAFGPSALAVGFVVGSAARLLIQLPALRAVGIALRPRWAVRDADFREVLRLVPPLLLGSAVVNVNTLVDRAIGSEQGEGTISALSLGWRVVTLVDTLLVVTVAAALFPALSRLGGSEQRAELRRLVDRSLGVVLVLLAPAATLLVVAPGPVVAAIYGRGDFDAEAVTLTATAVGWYAVSAVGIGVRAVASRACLAIGDARTPVTVALVAMVVNVAGDLTLGVAYGIAGLAVSTTASLVVAAVLAVALVARRHQAVDAAVVGRAATRVTAAAAAAGAAAWGVGRALPAGETALSRAGMLAAVGAVLLLAYVGALRLARSPELGLVAGLLGERLTALRRRS